MSSFNQKPIKITAPMTQSFWAMLRAQGVLNSIYGKPIRVEKIVWNDPGPKASFVITDASAAQNELAAENTPVDFVGADPFYPIDETWRDWQVTVLTGGDLYIHYR